MRYSFDSSSFINGRRDLLPPTILPTLWDRISDEIAAGSVRAIDAVSDEVRARDDEVAAWIRGQTHLFEPLSIDVQQSVRLVMREHPKLVNIGSGRSGADPFVIALAHARGATVVSEETASNRPDRPRIPDVCKALGVPCITLIGFIGEQGWTFR